jgi:hypothetical protein
MPEMISRGAPPARAGGGVLPSCCCFLRPVGCSVGLMENGLLCGALLVLYPNAFRRRYSEEMRRDFRELLLEALQEGGTAAQAKPRASWRKSCF